MARHFAKDYANAVVNDDEEKRIPVVVDTMSDEFDRAFAVWPERYFVVRDGKMVLVAKPTNEFGFDRGDLQHWLEMQRTIRIAKKAVDRL